VERPSVQLDMVKVFSPANPQHTPVYSIAPYRGVKAPRRLTKNLLEATPLPHVRNLLEKEAQSDHFLPRKELVRWH